MEKSKVKLLAVLVVILLVVSSGALIWLMTPSKNSTLIGFAYVDAPLVGATITVYDEDGDKIYEAQNATSKNGVFMQKVTWKWLQNVPREFRFTATGGTSNDAPFNGTLVRIVENYDQTNSYSINAITTLMASYRDRNPTSTNDQAEEAVHEFLEIPSELNITAIVNSPSATKVFFSGRVFLEEANQNGGLNAYVEALTLEIGLGQTHPFKGPPQFTGIALDVFKFVFTNVAKGALSEIGKQVAGTAMEPIMGWVMGVLGLNTDGTDYTAQQLSAISDKLNMTYDKLVEMDKKLIDISSKLSEISASISELRNALNTVNTELQLRMSQLSSYDALSKIDSSYTTLVAFATTRPGDIAKTSISEWSSAVINPTTGIYNALDVLDKIVRGHVLGDEKGLLEVMVDNLIAQIYMQDPSGLSLYGRTYRDKVMSLYNSFEAYFEKLLMYEVRGLTMIAEAHNARGESALVQSYIDIYWKPMIQNQIDLFISQVERLVINAEPRAQLEFPNMGPIPAADYDAMQIYWHANIDNQSMPSVAEILPRADHFADVLLNGTGKFIVRVLVIPPTINPVVTVPALVFRNVLTDEQITPVSVHKTVYKANTNLMYHLFTYDLGPQPAGEYVLVSPTVTNAMSPYTGWFSVESSEQSEWWSYLVGLKMSTRLGIASNSTLSYMTVAEDIYGNPYGYWGGIWAVENL